ncbi:MAG: alpha-L-rhamnosidase, partial [Lentisphaeria bacterium]|nr:alpha-L-rhamnosidase [Lentisphaeria bacterium]
ATYNAFAPEFYTKWIRDLNFSVFPNGSYPNIAPNPYQIKGKWALGSSGWGDAGLICPWTMFVKYADTRIMSQYFDNMCRWLDLQVRCAGGSLIVKNATYGDWLNIDAPTPEELISTAYLGGMNQLAANIAYMIGREDDGDYRVRMAQAIAEAYTREFFTPEGELKVKTQTAALLSLHFELIPTEFVPQTVEFLVKDIRENRNMHLSTGFLGTPLLLKVLTKHGHLDLAYDLLLQTSYPGWLYPITQGATTMWERWNSYTHKDGFGNVAMNSFNHYAYGAVGEWFYETICGIQPVDYASDAAGFQIFRLAPQPGKRIKEASASVMTLHGEIKSAWKRRGNTFTWEFTVPCNTLAEIVLPEDAEFDDADGMEENAGVWMANPGSYKVSFSL